MAAAEEVYRHYVAMSDAILSEGGRQPDRIRDFVAGDFLQATLEGFEEYETNGYRSVGMTSVTSFELQQYVPSGSGRVVLIAYACQDIGAVDVVDSNNVSVVAPSRPANLRLEVTFELFGSDFKISHQERWDTGEC